MSITVHTIVKNEENWIWYAINSVLNLIDKIIIYDTGSTDRTVEIIKSIKSPKIEFEEKGPVNAEELVELRNDQIEKTTTNWFMLLDGDEVWPKDALKSLFQEIKSSEEEKMAVVVRTRNCVGDIFHYLPENRGEYQLLGMKGHFNIRAYKKSPNFRWMGTYPSEAYSDNNGPINNQDSKLIFLDKYYWHLTHLKRSSIVNDFKKNKKKFELGVNAKKSEIPEIFIAQRPDIVPDPFGVPSFPEKLLAMIFTLVKDVKYKL